MLSALAGLVEDPEILVAIRTMQLRWRLGLVRCVARRQADASATCVQAHTRRVQSINAVLLARGSLFRCACAVAAWHARASKLKALRALRPVVHWWRVHAILVRHASERRAACRIQRTFHATRQLHSFHDVMDLKRQIFGLRHAKHTDAILIRKLRRVIKRKGYLQE